MAGLRPCTSGGLTADDLTLGPRSGCYVSKRKSRHGRMEYPGSKLEKWNERTKRARHYLGFEQENRWVPMGGKSADGQLLLATVRRFRREEGW